MSDKEDKDTAMENAVTRSLTRKEHRKKVVILECYRDFWKRSQRPVCSLNDADIYLIRAADIVIRIRTLLTPEGDTESPDGAKVLRAQSEDDVEKAVLECVNHVACGGNSAEMLWDLEQCPSADPAKFVRELVHATLRDADKYVFPTLDEAVIDRFIEVYNRLRPLGTVVEEEDMMSELEAVIEGLQKTVQGLTDVEVPKETLKDITKSLREIDGKLAVFLPKPKNPEPAAPEEQKQEQPAMESESPSPALTSLAGSCPATIEKVADDDAMVSEEEKKTEEPKAETKKEQQQQQQQKPADATEMVDDSQNLTPATRQDSCLLKINTISSETSTVRPKVEEIKKLVDALDAESLSKDPINGIEKVESIQRQSRGISENLMRALLALDAINANETTRPLRRNQVIEVQQLMDEMDQINAKLNEYSRDLLKNPAVIEKKKRESDASLAAHKDPVVIRKEKEKQEEKKPQTTTPEQQKTEEKNQEQEDEGKEEEEEEQGEGEGEEEEEEEEEAEEALLREMIPLWKSMKLRPRFEEQQQREAYVLTAMIPGLDRDDINISPNEDMEELVVSGVRLPTLDELKKMLHHINQLQQGNLINLKTKRGLQLALMQLGKGRYGSFEMHFSLPDDAIPESIHATYNGGRLGIVIPRQKRPQPRQYYPRYGGDGYPFDGFGGRGGFGGFPGFF